MALVESAVAFAFPFLEVRATLVRMDPALEEAARMSGASPARVSRKSQCRWRYQLSVTGGFGLSLCSVVVWRTGVDWPPPIANQS